MELLMLIKVASRYTTRNLKGRESSLKVEGEVSYGSTFSQKSGHTLKTKQVLLGKGGLPSSPLPLPLPVAGLVNNYHFLQQYNMQLPSALIGTT